MDKYEWICKEKVFLARRIWCFSYSRSQLDSVVKYISNQKEHHKKKSFTEEYVDFLKDFEVEYDDRYIFKPIE